MVARVISDARPLIALANVNGIGWLKELAPSRPALNCRNGAISQAG
ncbi:MULTISPECIES: hypothetical protein [unclassified Cyanobium]|nr:MULTISPECIES: hypothetical protein [unclassified Cyanobium]MCP9900335.1 hypothetical protein [Cyanobium sp. Cruz CV11-17]